MKRHLMTMVLALITLLAIGCPPKESSTDTAGTTGGADDTILIGEYGSLTGPEATFGQATHNGITMAVEEINAAGGINGKKLVVKTEDDQSKPEEAANAVSKLISQNGVVAVLGEVASSNTLAAAPIAQAAKIPMISPSSTNPRVTEVGDYIFRVCFIDPYQGEALAHFVVNELKVKNAAILRDVKSDYSMGLSDFFKKTFESLGGTIVVDQSYAKGDSDFKGQLTAIKAKSPGIIFVPGYYTDIGQIAIQARDLGINQPLVGGDGWESPKLIEIGGKALEGSFYSNHYHPDDPAPEVRTFVEKFHAKFGVKPDALTALGYDSAWVLAEAMKRAKSLDGTAIRDEIAKTNYKGVTGQITLGPDRNPTLKRLVVLEIKNGQLIVRTAVDPAGDALAAAAAAAPAAETVPGTTAPAATTTTAPKG